jgi:hypothetical protein
MGFVEVQRVAAFAPAEPLGVVHPRQTQRPWEQVGAPESEVGRVERAEAAARDSDLVWPAAVGGDEADGLLDDPLLVGAVTAGALLQRQARVEPGGRVEAVNRVDLDPAGVQQPSDGGDHAVVLVVMAVPLLGGEHQQRPAVVAVGEQAEAAAGPGQRQAHVVASHGHTSRRRSSR